MAPGGGSTEHRSGCGLLCRPVQDSAGHTLSKPSRSAARSRPAHTCSLPPPPRRHGSCASAPQAGQPTRRAGSPSSQSSPQRVQATDVAGRAQRLGRRWLVSRSWIRCAWWVMRCHPFGVLTSPRPPRAQDRCIGGAAAPGPEPRTVRLAGRAWRGPTRCSGPGLAGSPFSSTSSNHLICLSHLIAGRGQRAHPRPRGVG